MKAYCLPGLLVVWSCLDRTVTAHGHDSRPSDTEVSAEESANLGPNFSSPLRHLEVAPSETNRMPPR